MADLMDFNSSRFLQLLICLVLPAVLFVLYRNGNSEFPVVNGKSKFEFSDARVKKKFRSNARQLLRQGLKQFPGRPFNLQTDHGYTLMFPPEYANELRNSEDLNHVKAIAKMVNAHYPGMEAFHEFAFGGNIIQDAIKTKLTQALRRVTKPLSDETAFTLRNVFTDGPGMYIHNTTLTGEHSHANAFLEWHTIIPHEDVLRAVARVSSRLFLGDKLCRNEEWLAITTTYTHNLGKTVHELNYWPLMIRRIIAPYLPRVRIMRQEVKNAQALIGGVIKEREALEAQGKKPEYLDAIEWFKQIAKGRNYDPIYTQLSLSFLAIHTTADMITQLLFDLAEFPEWVQPLREEAIKVLTEHGWQKSSLYNLKLLDSVMKESQRLRPINDTAIQRLALKDVKLADGTIVPRGTILAVASTRHWDPAYYPDPQKFDGARFLKMRAEAGKEHIAQFVSTSPDHMGFGHGEHACPGRFFASNEVKIIMCHILLKYDWRLLDGQKPVPGVFGLILTADHNTRLEIRRRQPEIDLDTIE